MKLLYVILFILSCQTVTAQSNLFVRNDDSGFYALITPVVINGYTSTRIYLHTNTDLYECGTDSSCLGFLWYFAYNDSGVWRHLPDVSAIGTVTYIMTPRITTDRQLSAAGYVIYPEIKSKCGYSFEFNQ